MRWLQNVKLIPVLIIVACASFSIRVGEFYYELENMGSAYAQQTVSQEPPPLPEASEKDMAEVSEKNGSVVPSPVDTDVEWKDATEEDVMFSNVRNELYDDLSQRRQELDKREKQLSTREALLSAAERELDQKLREMTTIKNEIEALLKEQSAEEQSRINSLVKIYEGMKAKDAARIFNTLDMDVLIMVMSRMSERKSSPILAEMSPDRARTVTILLAQQKQLPSLSSQ